MESERIEVQRTIRATPVPSSTSCAIRTPRRIDSSGMLMSASGNRCSCRDSFVVTWTVKPERLPDGPLRRDGHDHAFEPIARSRGRFSARSPTDRTSTLTARTGRYGTLVTSYYDCQHRPHLEGCEHLPVISRVPSEHARHLARTAPGIS